MKSGTNQLLGSGFDYFANEALNAGTPFTNGGISNPAKAGQLFRNPLQQNDYGFTLGGPIVSQTPPSNTDPVGQKVCLNQIFDTTTNHVVNGRFRNPQKPRLRRAKENTRRAPPSFRGSPLSAPTEIWATRHSALSVAQHNRM
jgi:hypothetical protein